MKPNALTASLLLVLTLGAGSGPGAASQPAPWLPEDLQRLATPSTQRIAPLVQRFQQDLRSVEHVHDIDAGRTREAALRRLYLEWQQALNAMPTATMGIEDRLDHALLRRDLGYRLQQLDFQRARADGVRPLIPSLYAITDLLEARRALAYPDSRTSADLLDRARAELAGLQKRIEAGEKPSSAVIAFRAARMLETLRGELREWNTFHAGYDPQFTWWNKTAYESFDKQAEAYAKTLRDKLAGAADPEAIIGDPIGREALLRELQHEGIDYTPEELIALAEKELAWCQEQMRIAAKQMGAKDWRDALEMVKTRSPAPGDQPKLVVELADEAVAFLEQRQLITIPELSKRDWRMTMLTPEFQLQAPFFLGGEDVWVAYPTDSMPHGKKVMALRGNNRHFSRAVVHHELIPGHHLQFFMTRRYQPHREQFDSPFWTEGWALYWEMRLWDLDFAKTPEDRIGMLFWKSHRAARILFSLGFHSGKLTPQQAIDLLVERVGHERENAAAEVRRSFGGDWGPMYQAAYLLGGLQFKALHRDFVQSGKMSEREFHDAIMQGGPMPVRFVRARLHGDATMLDSGQPWRFYQ